MSCCPSVGACGANVGNSSCATSASGSPSEIFEGMTKEQAKQWLQQQAMQALAAQINKPGSCGS